MDYVLFCTVMDDRWKKLQIFHADTASLEQTESMCVASEGRSAHKLLSVFLTWQIDLKKAQKITPEDKGGERFLFVQLFHESLVLLPCQERSKYFPLSSTCWDQIQTDAGSKLSTQGPC